MRKRLSFGLTCLLLSLSAAIMAEDFSIEEENLSPLPKIIDLIIRSDKSFADYQECKLVGRGLNISGKEGSGFVATTSSVCGWGTYNGPFWVVDTTAINPKVVLFEIGAGLEVESKPHNGLRDIKTSGGSAGTCSTTRWKYRSGLYVRAKDRSCVPQ